MAIDINGDGLIQLGGTSTTQGRVRLNEDTDNGTNYVELTAPASVTANRTVTFPDADINFATGLSATLGGTGLTAVGANGNVLTSNGTAWVSAAPSGGSVSLKQEVFIDNTSWTCPAGVTTVEIQIWGGGGGGGAYNDPGCAPAPGGYGGAGGYVHGMLPVTPGTTYTITIGAGGAGNNGGTGSTGGTTSFGSLISCTGGAGGAINFVSGANGTATTTNLTSGTFFAWDGYGMPVSFQRSSGALNSFESNKYYYSGSTTAATLTTTNILIGPGRGGTGESGSTGGNNASGGVEGAIIIKYIG